MITRGIVEEVVDKYNIRVRLPIFDRASYADFHIAKKNLNVAVICTLPACDLNVQVGDVVFVAFEDGGDKKAFILGYLYRNHTPTTYCDLSLNTLHTIQETHLCHNTSIGKVTPTEISRLSGLTDNIQLQIDSLSQNVQSLYESIENNILTTVTPQDFGAVGDGATDDTSAIQSAINFAISNGVDMIFPSGEYRCSRIDITSQCRIRGVGEVRIKIKDDVSIETSSSFDTDTTCFYVKDVPTGGCGVIIENIHFDGNFNKINERKDLNCVSNYESCGVQLANSHNVIIKNCAFDNFKNAGVRIIAGCSYITIEECVFFEEGEVDAFNRGIQCIRNAGNTNNESYDAYYTFRNNRIMNTGEHGIVVYYTNHHVLIDGNYITNSGVKNTGPDGEFFLVNPKEMTVGDITDTWGDIVYSESEGTQFIISAKSSDYATNHRYIKDNVVYEDGGYSPPSWLQYTYGYNIKSASNSYMTIVNNYCCSARRCNIGISSDTEADATLPEMNNIIISNNTLLGFDDSSSANHSCMGISVESGKDVTITNNILKNHILLSENDYTYIRTIRCNASNSKIKGNTIRNSLRGIYAKDSVIMGNFIESFQSIEIIGDEGSIVQGNICSGISRSNLDGTKTSSLKSVILNSTSNSVVSGNTIRKSLNGVSAITNSFVNNVCFYGNVFSLVGTHYDLESATINDSTIDFMPVGQED